MDRIETIGLVNPEWAVLISNFLEVFPEFNKYRSIASLTDRGAEQRATTTAEQREDKIGGAAMDKVEGEGWHPKTIFEYCIYYPCQAGVNQRYADEQFKNIIVFLRSGDWLSMCVRLRDFLETVNVQPKKKQIYWDIFNWMHNNGVTHETITMSHVERMKNEVKGLGVTFISCMREQFTDDNNVCCYTDMGFINSYVKLYGTKAGIKEKSEMWMAMGFGRVANSFMFQIYHYGHLI